MEEKKEKCAKEAAIEEEMQALDKPKKWYADFLKKEDYWVIWLAALLLIIGLIIYLPNPPEDMHAIIERTDAIMQVQEQRGAPFKTIAWHQASREKGGLRARNEELAKKARSYLDRPGRWDHNPLKSFYLSEERAAIMREAAREEHEQAKEKLAAALAKAQEAEAAASDAMFRDHELNRQAHEAITAWTGARGAESSARRAATIEGYNKVLTLVVLCVVLGLFFTIGTKFMGRCAKEFLMGFPFVFLIATISFFIASNTTIAGYGLGYVVWAILIGLLISNTVGTPKWVKPAVQTEYYIKTGLVLLGSAILFGLILAIGGPGLLIAWIVTPIVLLTGFWVGDKIIKIPSKPLNMCVAAASSVSGVSAAIAVAAATRAKREELTIAVGMSLAFTAVFMFALPAFVKAVGMNPVLGGAWIGGTVDSTGAVVAAGELLGPAAMYVAATIKMIQNILIGVIGFGVATYWTLKIERREGVNLGFISAIVEIWTRFPKFILGFAAASIIFTIIHEILGSDVGKVMISEGIIRGWSSPLRGWMFALAFTSIGLATNFRELAKYFYGGKIIVHYIFTQGLNVILTLFVAWVAFFILFPDVLEKLMRL